MRALVCASARPSLSVTSRLRLKEEQVRGIDAASLSVTSRLRLKEERVRGIDAASLLPRGEKDRLRGFGRQGFAR